MIENGVKLFAEADKFDMAAGTLLSCLRPPNTLAVSQLAKQYRLTLMALCEYLIDNVKRNIADGGAGSEQRQRRNRTISVLRRQRKKFSGIAYDTLRGKLRY